MKHPVNFYAATGRIRRSFLKQIAFFFSLFFFSHHDERENTEVNEMTEFVIELQRLGSFDFHHIFINFEYSDKIKKRIWNFRFASIWIFITLFACSNLSKWVFKLRILLCLKNSANCGKWIQNRV